MGESSTLITGTALTESSGSPASRSWSGVGTDVAVLAGASGSIIGMTADAAGSAAGRSAAARGVAMASPSGDYPFATGMMSSCPARSLRGSAMLFAAPIAPAFTP